MTWNKCRLCIFLMAFKKLALGLNSESPVRAYLRTTHVVTINFHLLLLKANNTDFIMHFWWLQEKQLVLLVHWKWITVNVVLHTLFSLVPDIVTCVWEHTHGSPPHCRCFPPHLTGSKRKVPCKSTPARAGWRIRMANALQQVDKVGCNASLC